ncbi:hypothetical protein HYY70_02595 [Candidatus Woesearchaeota archaeon]|nr:hypothetical protein [Candidatus Woesearchaeota archaeon]
MYLFSNIIGVFVFNEKFDLVDKILFNNPEDCKNKSQLIDEMRNKYQSAKEPDQENLKKILPYFKNKEFFNRFYTQNLQITKLDVKNSVGKDTLIIQAINSIDELDKTINALIKRLRDWYGLYNPEFSISTGNHEKFVEEVVQKQKNELLNALNITPTDSIGADLRQEDIEPIKKLAHRIYDLYQLRNSHIKYISTLMDEICPSFKSVCGILVGAKLIEHAGSLKRLSEMPASTIQILGAESALFRHMKTGAKPPRHGIIFHHPLISVSPDKLHGKIARALADKISIAVKVDYFKGQFIGDKLRKDLEEKFQGLK